MEDLNQVWNKVAYSYDRMYEVSTAFQQKLDRVVGLVIKENAKNVLDLGCGSGSLEKGLIKAGFAGQIRGLDASEEMLKIARASIGAKDDISFHLADLNKKLPFDDEHFDCVVAINVMFCIEDKVGFMTQARGVLEEDGCLILINPKPEGKIGNFFAVQFAGSSLLDVLKSIMSGILNVGHILKVARMQLVLDRGNRVLYQDLDEIKSLLDESGFKIEISEEIQAGQNWLFVGRKTHQTV